MKKIFFAVLCACTLLAACDDDDNEVKVLSGNYVPKSEAIILCEGSYGGNNSCLALLSDGEVTTGIYATANGQDLGDTGQDLLHTDGAWFVSVSTSAYIARLNEKTYKEEARYTCTEADNLPRYLASDGDYLYVSTYAGKVLKLQLSDLTKVAEAEVGSYPEQIAIVGSHLLCCNSGYSYGNTVSAISLKTFAVEKTIEVPMNPTRIVAGKNDVAYCLTTAYTADWTSATGTISSIDTRNDFKVETVCEATQMAVSGSTLYLCNCVPDYMTYTYSTAFMKYDMEKKQMSEEPVLASDTLTDVLASKCIYLFDVNAKNGELFIGTTDYYSNSTLYVTDRKGQSWTSVDAGGVNASRVGF